MLCHVALGRIVLAAGLESLQGSFKFCGYGVYDTPAPPTKVRQCKGRGFQISPSAVHPGKGSLTARRGD